jgi:hypothetical protein
MIRNLEHQIRRLVAEGRYPEAAPLLEQYAADVVEHCKTAADEQEFQAARAFLRSTLNLVKAQRAHDQRRLEDLNRQQRYHAAIQLPQPNTDVTG